MKKGRRLFTLLDIVVPWSVCLLSAALCAWGAIVAQELPAKIISVATGLVFLSGIPFWYIVRSTWTRLTFTTVHGIGVVHGKRNRPSKGMIEEWTTRIIRHWAERRFKGRHSDSTQFSSDQIADALKGTVCYFVDKEKLSVWGRFVRAYTWGANFIVGWRPDSIEQQGTTDNRYVRGLFDHESGHIILGFNGEGWDEKHHHEIQAKVGSSFVPESSPPAAA